MTERATKAAIKETLKETQRTFAANQLTIQEKAAWLRSLIEEAKFVANDLKKAGCAPTLWAHVYDSYGGKIWGGVDLSQRELEIEIIRRTEERL